MEQALDFGGMERKWQKRWYDGRVFDSEPKEGQGKYFIIFAYPGTSGYLHVGHMRAYTYADILARHMRMRGCNVLFPVGVHATGNVSITPARKVERGDPETLEYFRANGCPEEQIKKLSDPLEIVRFFSRVYVDDYWKRFGFSADFRRFATTMDPGYMRFISWQFLKLDQRGLLIQKPYFGTACVNCGPVAVDASETDIRKGGAAEKQEYTLLKFGFGNEFLIAATLRPETVFGQTNFWANPEVTYVRAEVDGERWIISRECADKLVFQKDSVKIVGEIPGSELLGKRCQAPMIGREIPILPSSFCDPDVGSGLVTSVPSDAPFDWIALEELKKDADACKKFGIDCEMVRAIKPIPIIKTKGYGELPAKEICERLGITSVDDPKLEEATKEIYKAGFHTGVMADVCSDFAGLPVGTAKDKMRDAMVAAGEASTFYGLSEEVVCRCGGKVVIKKIPDQWFINYADAALTSDSKRQAGTMTVLPREYFNNLPAVLDWFQERACARQGNWLGTPLPQDKGWTVEAISDSTLYPAYYVVSKYVNSGELRPEQMDEAFFDFVFLGQDTGKVPEIAKRVRADFEYWYPLDVNLGGKEHMTVHFPVFLMNHVALLPERFWPHGILVNWFITMKGGKVSKSKGGAEPIPDAVARFSVDGMRFYYGHVANPFVDVEWDEETVAGYRQRLERIFGQFEEMRSGGRDSPTEMDAWLEARVSMYAARYARAMDAFDLRDAANCAFFELPNDLRWCRRRGGASRAAVAEALSAWVRLMSPFAPHVAEEMWERLGGNGLVSLAGFPKPSPKNEHAVSIAREEYLERLMGDIAEIEKVTGKKPEKLVLFTAEPWKAAMHAMASRLKEAGQLQMNALMKEAMSDPSVKQHAKEASAFAAKLAKEMQGGAPRALLDGEEAFLRTCAPFLAAELGCDVSVHVACEQGVDDPFKKARQAAPGRPAIYAR
ncbi:MAG: leucine--tRNA ligase [Methanobacteriota archaeon]